MRGRWLSWRISMKEADGEGPADRYRVADAQLIGGSRAARGQLQAEEQERGAAVSHGYLAGAGSLMRM